MPRTGNASDLTSAAQSLENDLARLEEAVRDAKSVEVVSDKTLQKVRKLLDSCSQHQLRLAEHLQVLVTAMQSAQVRVQESMDQTIQLARRVGERAAERGELVERFAALGKRTAEIQAPVQVVVEKHAEGAGPDEILMAVNAVLALAEALVAESDAVLEDARAGGWVDITKETDTLRQQILGAKNKVSMLRRNLSSSAPS